MKSRDHRLLIHGGEITAFDMLKSVKWEAHRGLLSSIPTMLRHLREDGISDPTLFLRRELSMELLAGDLLRSFFNNQTKLYDMSVRKTREICAWRTPHVLACAIRNVVQFSAQPLIPSETSLRLLAISGALRPLPLDKRVEMVTEIVEEMSAWRFEILAALISFLHDCSSPKSDLARELGPLMLLRDGVTLAPIPPRGGRVPDVVHEQNQINDEMAAGEAFRVLIDECPSIFGLVAAFDPSQTVHQRFNYSAPEPAAAHVPQRYHSQVEEKSLLDEEKMSNASMANLYEGMSTASTAGSFRRKSKSKKASTFYNIIARTSSNLSSSKESNSDAGTPTSVYKPGSLDRPVPGRTVPVVNDSSSSITGKIVSPPSAKRPLQQERSATSLDQGNGVLNSSSSTSWQDRRPPPVATSTPSATPPTLTPARTPQSQDAPAIATKGSFPTNHPVTKTQNAIPQTGTAAIKQQNSFGQNSGNPLIKTQTSFSQNSRPATPTSLISARRNLISDIQNGSASNILRTTSFSPVPNELKQEAPPSPIPAPVSHAPPPAAQRPLPQRLEQPQPQQGFSPVTVRPPIQADKSGSVPPSPQNLGQIQHKSSSFVVPATMTNGSSASSSGNNMALALDGDGPTIFEQEMLLKRASVPSVAPPAQPIIREVEEEKAEEKPVAAAPNQFEEELRRRTLSVGKPLLIDMQKLREEEEEAIREEARAAKVAEAAAAAAATATTAGAATVKPKAVDRPKDKPRHSFIPRITSPNRNSEGAGKSFDQLLAEKRHELEAEAEKAAASEATRSALSRPPIVANDESSDGEPQSSEDEEGDEMPPPKPPKPGSLSSSKTESFQDKLAARRATVEARGSIVESPDKRPSKSAESFDEKLAARKATVEKRGSVVESSAQQQRRISTKPESFEEKLAARKANVESRGSVVESSRQHPSSSPMKKPSTVNDNIGSVANKRSVFEQQPTSPTSEASTNSNGSQGKPKSFTQVIAERKVRAESDNAVKPPPPSTPNPNRAAASSTGGSSSSPAKPAPPPYPNPNRSPSVTNTPPSSRPKPVPPKPTPSIRELSTDSAAFASSSPIALGKGQRTRPSLTLQMNDVAAATPVLKHVPESPSSPNDTSSPEISMENKLANLRALLKPGQGSGTLTLPPTEPAPEPVDTKKRTPPPDHPPPPGAVKMEKEGGVQIVGDWRTEYSPQYKAQFWVNLLTGAVQWHHPMRERSLSTKQRENQSKDYAPVVTSVTVKVPENRRTIHEAKVETPASAKVANTTKATPNKSVAATANTLVRRDSSVDATKSIESIARQNSDIQKNLHQSYRRASLRSEDFQAQQSAQFDEAESFVIAAARAAGESIVECIFDFTPADPNNTLEMAIRVGEKLRIYEKGADGWWGGVKVKDGRQRGLFPEAYVRLI